jgi:glycosyltransferase involved in cell wall biosynthesis
LKEVVEEAMKTKVPTVAVVAPYYFPKAGGLENYARHGVQTLCKAGFRVVVFASADKGSRLSVDEVDGVRVYRLPRLFTLSNTAVNPLWPLQLRSLFKREGVDIINAHTPVPVMADAARLARGRRPILVTYHCDLEKSGLIGKILCRLENALLTRPTLVAADGVIATSDYYADHSRVLSGIATKAVISAPGVDIDVFRRPAAPQVVPGRFIFVAQLDRTHRHKGLDQLLEAIPLAKRTVPDLSLVVVGRGDDRERYAAKAAALDIADCVDFNGFVPDDALAKLYSSAEAVVLPSQSDTEGFGMVILEAAACGAPAVATRVGGIPAAVVDGATGLLVPPGDPDSLSAALVRIAQDVELRDRLGRNAYERVTENFTWDVQGRVLVRLVEESLSEVGLPILPN